MRDRLDGERGLERVIAPPAARALDRRRLGDDRAHGARLRDRPAGRRARRASSPPGRFEGRPGARASSAFDGTPRAWIGSFEPGRPAWIEWTLPRPATIRELRLTPPRRAGAAADDGAARRRRRCRSPPTARSRCRARSAPAASGSRSSRPTFPEGTPGVIRQRRAVGIGEIDGAGVPRVRGPALGRAERALRRPRGHDRGGVVGRRASAAPPRGRHRRARRRRRRCASAACGAPVSLPAGPARLSLPAGVLAPVPHPPALAGPVAGRAGRRARPGRRLRRAGPQRPPGHPARSRRSRVARSSARPTARAGGRAATAATSGRRGRSTATRWAGASTPAAASRTSGSRPTASSGSATGSPLRCCWRSCSCCSCAARPSAATRPPAELPETDPVARMPVGRAALVALLAGAALGFVFAARSAPVIALATFLVLWRGVGVRALIAVRRGAAAGRRPAAHARHPGARPGRLQLRATRRSGSPSTGWRWPLWSCSMLALARTLSTARGRRAAAPGSAP